MIQVKVALNFLEYSVCLCSDVIVYELVHDVLLFEMAQLVHSVELL